MTYCIRNDKLANRPMLFPRLRDQDAMAFPQNSSRVVRQPATRAAAAIRRFSNSVRNDGSPPRQTKVNKIFEINTLQSSYESLASEPDPNWVSSQTTVPDRRGDKTGRFRWSRIRQNLGRDPPKTPLTIFDQLLYRPGIPEASHSKTQSHVPHDEFLSEIPRLPFPLISLPEAHMLQYFRRERGEEDHTDPTSSFAGRMRHGTFSTISSSNGPRTPTSPLFDIQQDHLQTGLPKPGLVRHSDAWSQAQRRLTGQAGLSIS